MKQIDRIRNMNAEKMANILISTVNCGNCPAEHTCSLGDNCHEKLTAWLESEVEKDE